ncbi:tetratricopeptide repeat protein [Pedobacter frigidisoli]|uniref:tetratricopeptide repeat protein n=1 Tax=Pedobacter frigidisoli TaxID=2530455 RepID=UPI00292E3AED|nr:tetratricopeptide repeat protein [Pedobacter frigidisoli]
MKKLVLLFFILVMISEGRAQNSGVVDKEKLFDFYQSQRYAEAGEYLKEVYGSQNDDPKILTQIGYCFLMASNFPEAEKFYVKAYTLQPTNLPILFSLASINTRRGNNERARNYYGEIVKADSNNFSVYKLLANLYSHKDSMRLVYLLKANRLNPSDGDVADNLAEMHSLYQNYDKAYSVLNIALNADSENLVLQRAKLPVANQLKKYKEVIISGERLLKDLRDAGVIKDVAKAYYFTRDYQKAINLFEELEKLNMQNEATLYFTSLAYRALKNFPVATAYTKKTIEEAISPNTSSYYGLLGMVYQENNKYDLALAAYKKGLQFKANPTLYYRLGILYDAKLGNSKTALRYYHQYLYNKPNFTDEKEEIKYTKARIAQLTTPVSN